jgi:hypothetical protein
MRVLLIVLATFLSGCAGVVDRLVRFQVDRERHLLTYQIRTPVDVELPPLTSIFLTTNRSASGKRVKYCKSWLASGQTHYEASTLIFKERRRRLVITPPGQPAQVFILKFPAFPRPSEWGEWQAPDFLDKSESPGWSNVHNVNLSQRDDAIPHDHLEIRFRVEKHKSRVDRQAVTNP